MRYLIVIMLGFFVACSPNKSESVRFMVADPGHFHAALVLKQMVPNTNGESVSEEPVYIYAPDGPELDDFLNRVEGYNHRAENPTHWDLKVVRDENFFQKMLEEKPGNVVVFAGNNQKKTEYILQAIQAGLNVYADKPMAINPEDYTLLKEAFETASDKGVMLYDIMTERFEITSILQKALMHQAAIFGSLQSGTPDDPAIVKESVHHFFKYVSGSKLQRPPWFFDVEQEGEGTVDVTTHLIDLVQWACFPGEIIDYDRDINLLDASRWPTLISKDQFNEVTGIENFPEYLSKDCLNDSTLAVYCNGEIHYSLRGVNTRVKVTWNFQAPEGGGDTHLSVIRGSLCNLEIRQGAEQNYRPELFILADNIEPSYTEAVRKNINELAAKYPGIELEEVTGGWKVVIPDRYRVGHEAHFGQVTQQFLSYLSKGTMPEWEVPNMLAKYRLTTSAYLLSH